MTPKLPRPSNGPVVPKPIGIVRKAIADLEPADYNPRTITDPAMVGLQNSLRRFGVVQPVVYNRRTGRIVGGHQRVAALQALGETEVDVVVVDLFESEEKALNVALNNPAISGEFTDSLKELLDEIETETPDLFDDLNLDELLDPDDDPFEPPEAWEKHWRGMPLFHQEDLTPDSSIVVHFENEKDRLRFADLVGQTVTEKTRSLWYPEAEIGRMVDKRYISRHEDPNDRDPDPAKD